MSAFSSLLPERFEKELDWLPWFLLCFGSTAAEGGISGHFDCLRALGMIGEGFTENFNHLVRNAG